MSTRLPLRAAFVFLYFPSMVAKKPDNKPRPVFLPAALSRMMKQPLRRKARSAAAIISFVAADAMWWLTQGLWQVPTTLRLARRRKVVPVYPGISMPAMHLYESFDTLQKSSEYIPKEDTPAVLYVHGGAWGAGDAMHYSQLACKIADESSSDVYILSYRLYPAVGISRQVEDVIAALRFIRKNHPRQKLFLLAHSSGAHVSALALLRSVSTTSATPLADVAFFSAGPFHLMHHFLFESRRGVADISPMLPAAGADRNLKKFDGCSPSVIAESFESKLAEHPLPTPPPALEGEIVATNVPLPDVETEKDGIPFPRIYVATSSCDTVVPMYSSLRFAAALRKLGANAQLLVYDGVEHIQFVTDWFRGASSRDLSGLLDIEETDQNRRSSCVRHLAGPEHEKLVSEIDASNGSSPYVRDVLRILRSLRAPQMNGNDGHV